MNLTTTTTTTNSGAGKIALLGTYYKDFGVGTCIDRLIGKEMKIQKHQTEYGSLGCYKGTMSNKHGRNGLSNGQLVSYIENIKLKLFLIP